MRILLLTHYYPPEFGAPQRRWGAFVRRFVEAGHRVAVVAPVPHYPDGSPVGRFGRDHPPGAVERGEGGELVLRTAFLPHRGDIATRTADHLVAAADGMARAAWRFRDRRHRPDVVIATAPAIPSLLVGRALASRWRVPLVVEMRDAWPDLVTHVGATEPGRPPTARTTVVALLRRRVHETISLWQRGATRVVTTTEHFAEVLRDRGVRRVDVVRNGTDLDRVPAPADRPRAEGSPLRVLYLGNMGRSQGLGTAVEAAARLHREGVPLEVRMIGHGHAAEELARLARERHAPVTVGERVPHNLVRDHYAWADTVLVPLRDWAPFAWTVPSKLYEVLATGRHVTGVLAGEAADVVRDAGAGDVVPPGDVDALAALWRGLQADRSRLDRAGSGRRWVVEHAEDDLLARRYLALLEDATRERAGHGGHPAPVGADA